MNPSYLRVIHFPLPLRQTCNWLSRREFDLFTSTKWPCVFEAWKLLMCECYRCVWGEKCVCTTSRLQSALFTRKFVLHYLPWNCLTSLAFYAWHFIVDSFFRSRQADKHHSWFCHWTFIDLLFSKKCPFKLSYIFDFLSFYQIITPGHKDPRIKSREWVIYAFELFGVWRVETAL